MQGLQHSLRQEIRNTKGGERGRVTKLRASRSKSNLRGWAIRVKRGRDSCWRRATAHGGRTGRWKILLAYVKIEGSVAPSYHILYSPVLPRVVGRELQGQRQAGRDGAVSEC